MRTTWRSLTLEVTRRIGPLFDAMTAKAEITMLGGERLRVEEDAKELEAAILAAARGSIMELAWITEAQTGQRIGINPDHVLLLRALTE
jgi:hypothetical protein